MTKSFSRPDYDVQASVNISFPTSAQARAAVKALIPDNVNMHAGLTLLMSSKGKTIVIQVDAKKVPMGTVVSTLDEVLEHISVARRVMEDRHD